MTEHCSRCDKDLDPFNTETAPELLLICERQGLEYETVAKVVYRYTHPGSTNGPVRSLEFDMADKLLCGMGRWELWRTEFIEYYENVNLRMTRCAHEDCKVDFEPKTGPGTIRGGNPQIYCSRTCATSAANGNHRHKKTDVRPVLGTHATRCRNGHERTEENTIKLKSGKIRCRTCNNAGSARGYHKRRAAAVAA